MRHTAEGEGEGAMDLPAERMQPVCERRVRWLQIATSTARQAIWQACACAIDCCQLLR